MRTILDLVQADGVANTRILFLPAAYARPEDFLQAGFASAVRERGLPIDLVFADPNLQHLADRTLLRRLRHELVLPARALGCHSIWICGVSLGGFISLAYAERYANELDGLCLLAPYLGNHIITGEVARAGVAAWQPGDLDQDDDERRVWHFIKTHQSRPLPLHLGFGSEDRFADSQRLMAAEVRPENLYIVPGGHEWPVWRRLWDNFLDLHFAALAPRRPGLASPTAGGRHG
ncbi:MAG TPA: alpha/beta fold hydrolase [Steroidobacteraceae bacterium]|jgi:pimeloyl-ACP methyl ester carboxylesterase